MTVYLKTAAGNAEDQARLEAVRETVTQVIADVRARGDVAVREYSETVRRLVARTFRLDAEEIEQHHRQRAGQVDRRHRDGAGERPPLRPGTARLAHDFEIETAARGAPRPAHIPVAAAGAYVPGGRYPLVASAHMTVVTAKVAGVERVTACTPPIRGEIPAATVAAMHLAGADEIYLLGGVQAVAAMALGTETIERVNLIAGPGNAYVAEAKRQLFGEVGIDLFAGPTEILDHRRRRRRPVRRRRRPAQPGRARPRLARRAHHHVARRLARRVMSVHRRAAAGHADRTTSPARRGATTARCSWSTTSTRRTPSPTRSPPSTCRCSPTSPREALDAMHELRRAVPRRGHLRLLRRQGDRHQPRAADAWRGALHRRPVGRQVPEDRHVPGGHRPSRRARRWVSCAGGRRAVELFEGHARSGDVRAAKYRPAADAARGPTSRLDPVGEQCLTGSPDARRSSPAAATASAGRWRPPSPSAGVRVVVAGRTREHARGHVAARASAARRPGRARRRRRSRVGGRAGATPSPTRRSRSSSTTPVSPVPWRRWSTSSVDEWDEVFAVNVRGTFLMCRAFLPPMIERGAGDIINVASVSGKRPLARRTPTAPRRWRCIGLTTTLAAEVGPARRHREQPVARAGQPARGWTATSASRPSGPARRRGGGGRVRRRGRALHRMVTEDEVGAAVVAMLQMPGLHAADIDLSAGMVAR